MKLKNIVFLGFTFLIVLCGCTNNNTPSIENDNLTIYSLDKLYFYNEYTVNDLENLVVYFPVATNKEITSTELGGVCKF